MKIAIVITGGTLGSILTADGLAVGDALDLSCYEPLLERVREQFPAVEFKVERGPFHMDSSQLMPEHFSMLATRVTELLHGSEPVDGVVIGTGTDTMPYQLGGLSTALGAALDRAVALVCGMQPWHVPGSDGLRNFLDGVRIASSGKYTGVMLVHWGRVYGPANVRKVSHEAVDAFRQIQFRHPEGFPKLNEHLPVLLGRGQSIDRPLAPGHVVHFNPAVLPDRPYDGQEIRPVVAQIPVYPGLTKRLLLGLAEQGIEHLILQCYANGTCCVEKGEYSVAEAVAELRHAGVAVYAVSQQLGSIAPEDYSVCKALEKAGALYVRRLIAETLHATLLVLAAMYSSPEAVRSRIEEADSSL